MSTFVKFVLAVVQLLSVVYAQGCPFNNLGKRDESLFETRENGKEPSLTTLQNSFGKCSTISDAAGGGTRSRDWWPCQLRLDVLRQFSAEQNPLGGTFDYPTAFASINCMKPSQDELRLE